MWHSSILIHAPPLTMKQKTNVYCGCPFSGSDGPTRLNQVINTPKPKLNPHQYKLPPGPSLLHLLGLTHYAVRSIPYHHPLRELANTYGPLVHVKLGEVSTIVVSSADIAKQVLKTHEPAFADRPRSVATQVISYDYTDVILSPYNDYWKQMRGVCVSQFLNAKNVRSMEHMRQDAASSVVESIRRTRGESFDLTELIAVFMNSMACRAVFGDAVSLDSMDAAESIKRGVSLGAGFGVADMFPSIKVLSSFSMNKYRMMKLKGKIDKVLDKIIDDHRKKRALKRESRSNDVLDGEDLVDVLLGVQETQQPNFSITDDNIKSVVADMFGAAIETSSSLVDWAMAELMRNPHVMAKAQDEIRNVFNGKKTIQEKEIQTLEYLKNVVKETLRLHPPTAIITRACREEIQIEGYRIPVGANVIVNNWAIGRDPEYWNNPESFEPERFEANPMDFMGSHFEFIPFGSGKRMCPGLALGMANAEFLLAQLLFHFDWKLPPGMSPEDTDMIETEGMAVSRKNSLYVNIVT